MAMFVVVVMVDGAALVGVSLISRLSFGLDVVVSIVVLLFTERLMMFWKVLVVVVNFVLVVRVCAVKVRLVLKVVRPGDSFALAAGSIRTMLAGIRLLMRKWQ